MLAGWDSFGANPPIIGVGQNSTMEGLNIGLSSLGICNIFFSHVWWSQDPWTRERLGQWEGVVGFVVFVFNVAS